MSTYNDLLQSSRKLLHEQMVTDAEIDAWYLLSYVFGISRTDLLLQGDRSVIDVDAQRYIKMVGMRAEHTPLQYITGSQEFMGLEFKVTPEVLIPRQDTENLVEEVLKLCNGKSVLDMCTGSGCIIISIARLGKPGKAVGVDISTKALKVAMENAVNLGAEIEFFNSDLFHQVEDRYDIIVSNPPYIPTMVVKELMPEVKDHEPVLALDGDEDGLSFYLRIASQSKEHFNANGMLFLEIGHDQGNDVREILLQEGFADIIIKKDLSGLDRVVIARCVASEVNEVSSAPD